MKPRTYLSILLCLLLLLPLTLGCWGLLLPCQYEDTFLGELKYKVRLLEDTPGPRIILVGGSAVAFGVDSEALEQELPDYHVVNFGMYAALGTTVMLDLSEPFLQAGDIVVLMPEQQEQALSDWFDPEIMWQGLDGAFPLLQHLPREKLRGLLGAYPAFAGDKLRRFLMGTPPQPQGVYARSSFSARGDVDTPLCDRNRMPGGYDPNTPILFDGDIVAEEFLERVERYARAAEARGAMVCYAMCPMNRSAVTGEKTVEDYYQSLTARCSIPVIGDPRDSLLDAGWFFDTNFHLNGSGRQLYTAVLTDSLKAMLGDSSPTLLSRPVMPEPEDAPVWQGDNSDGSLFTYERQGDAWTVTGLTPEGQNRETLTVPSTWQDAPVRSISSGAFTDCPKLASVRIQQNIRSIADGAFSGCALLTQIVLEQPVPSACRVGQGLLEGTDAALSVPKGALPAYRTDYFWSIYGDRLE